jgi:hypothetical protein
MPNSAKTMDSQNPVFKLAPGVRQSSRGGMRGASGKWRSCSEEFSGDTATTLCHGYGYRRVANAQDDGTSPGQHNTTKVRGSYPTTDHASGRYLP